MPKNNKTFKSGIETKRQNNESVGSLFRRFTQRIRKSGLLMEVRERNFRKRVPNKRARRKSALVRVERREKYRKLKKWGKVK
ncbi:MAG: hypothetical protein A2919_01575 [Candidatus Spechtbacteria bacterium RIFCSPLOWO2_01_FULL_43_12]|uniref:30S ribosomal protein S21 n=1 Tax=Candidatus Spechtbacteria bacterium RIFCSPLOWO2_01_FULL_43_12 TaxID=1802162 RepID=A0A1G2HFD7_9BACT|nr:MAG: hypothetical protein A2919_01575 [Candidatus Spechtbacteria bacterium RIFCSPLOWO2_01_FULL_43_12]